MWRGWDFGVRPHQVTAARITAKVLATAVIQSGGRPTLDDIADTMARAMEAMLTQIERVRFEDRVRNYQDGFDDGLESLLCPAHVKEEESSGSECIRCRDAKEGS